MIKNLNIKNYKGFENLKINGLSNINLIGGENNIGKTSLLEAIFTFYNRLNSQVIINQLLWRGVTISLKSNKPHEIWLPVFQNYDIEKIVQFQFEYVDNVKYNVEIRIEKNDISTINPEKISKFNNTNTQNNVSEYSLHIKSLLADEVKQDILLYFLNNNIVRKVNTLILSDKIKPATFVSPLLRNASRDAVQLSEIIREGYEDEVIKALRIIDNRIKSVMPLAVSEQESVIHVDIGIGKKVPIYYLGDGTVRLLEYTLAIIGMKNGTVLIDEIENGIHYSKQKDVWKFLFTLAKKHSVQIFATTHSKEMTEAFINFAIKEKFIESSMYIELFRNYRTKKISANTIDIDTLAYKIINRKNFRGE